MHPTFANLGRILTALVLAAGLHCGRGSDVLRWDGAKETLDVSLKGAPLIPTLEELARQTGWHIYLEPTPGKTFTTEFKGLARGQAMRVMIGDMNYAFVPQADGPTRLYIFRTSRDAATLEIKARPKAEASSPSVRKVPNQLVVKLKPGAKIEDIARQLGAKVKARIGDLNAYLLEFDSNDGVETARRELASNEDVESTDYNYYVDAPPAPRKLDRSPVPPPQLSLKPPLLDGRVVIGMVDTAVQPLSGDLQKFLLQQISVAGEAALPGEPAHGTSMAETMLRALQSATGGNTSVQILPVDVYGPNTTATTFDVANGIIRAVNNNPPATIINLSLGSYSDSSFLRSTIQQVSRLGIPLFAAAGNEPVTTAFLPAAWPEMISVTASGRSGQLAEYANRAPSVDMMAPGTSIVHFNGQAWVVMGTSAASAYAAGLAAGLADSRGVSSAEAAKSVQTALHFTPAPAQ